MESGTSVGSSTGGEYKTCSSNEERPPIGGEPQSGAMTGRLALGESSGWRRAAASLSRSSADWSASESSRKAMHSMAAHDSVGRSPTSPRMGSSGKARPHSTAARRGDLTKRCGRPGNQPDTRSPDVKLAPSGERGSESQRRRRAATVASAASPELFTSRLLVVVAPEHSLHRLVFDERSRLVVEAPHVNRDFARG